MCLLKVECCNAAAPFVKISSQIHSPFFAAAAFFIVSLHTFLRFTVPTVIAFKLKGAILIIQRKDVLSVLSGMPVPDSRACTCMHTQFQTNYA